MKLLQLLVIQSCILLICTLVFSLKIKKRRGQRAGGERGDESRTRGENGGRAEEERRKEEVG